MAMATKAIFVGGKYRQAGQATPDEAAADDAPPPEAKPKAAKSDKG